MDTKDLEEEETPEEEESEELEETEEEPEEEGELDENVEALDTNPVNADSETEEEVPEEEAVEGMKVGEEKKKKTKSLPNSKKKSLCPECGKENCKCQKKDLTNEEAGQVQEHLEQATENTEEDKEQQLQPHQTSLDDYEKKKVGEAAGHLYDLSKEENFGHEQQMKSYHAHKNLEEVAMGGHKSLSPASDTFTENVLEGAGQATGEGLGAAGMVKNFDQMDDTWHPHRKACGMASKFLKDLSSERAFGDRHRETALLHHQSLADINKTEEPTGTPSLEHKEGTSDYEEPSEYETKSLKDMLEKRQNSFAELAKKMASLSKILVSN